MQNTADVEAPKRICCDSQPVLSVQARPLSASRDGVSNSVVSIYVSQFPDQVNTTSPHKDEAVAVQNQTSQAVAKRLWWLRSRHWTACHQEVVYTALGGSVRNGLTCTRCWACLGCRAATGRAAHRIATSPGWQPPSALPAPAPTTLAQAPPCRSKNIKNYAAS